MIIVSAFRMSFRNIIRNKAHTIINVGGLSLGVSCAIIVGLILKHELSYDSFHADLERIYQVVAKTERNGRESFDTGVPYPMPAAMKAGIPQIERITVFDANFANEPVVAAERDDGTLAKVQDDNVVAYVNREYFEIFTYAWLHGDPRTALSSPNTAVITASLAEKYFGTANAMGKSLTINATSRVQISGVVAEPPQATELPSLRFSHTNLACRGALSCGTREADARRRWSYDIHGSPENRHWSKSHGVGNVYTISHLLSSCDQS